MVRLVTLGAFQHGLLPLVGPAEFVGVLGAGRIELVGDGFQPSIITVQVFVIRCETGSLRVDTDEQVDVGIRFVDL